MALSTRRAPRAGVQRRYASALGAKSVVDESSRTLDLSFSSDAPIPRWFGKEILSHDADAVDLSRVDSGDAPLLLNHSPDQIIGTVESARVVGGKGRATVRFAKTAEGQRAMDLVNDRILRSVSVGYQVNRYVYTPPADGDDDEDGDTFTATRWQPMELSLVAVPADTSVGVGRSLTPKDRRTMENDDTPQTDAPLTRSQRAQARREADEERDRAATIARFAEQHRMLERLPKWLATGASVEQVRTEILEARRTQPIGLPPAETGDNAGLRIGMTEREARSFSITRALLGAISGDWSNAGFERSAIEAAYKASGRQRTSEHEFQVPLDVIWRVSPRSSVRSPYATDPMTTGGALVETKLLAGEFIQVLRNRSVTGELGAKYISGLVGNVALPRQTSQSTAYWVAENGTITETEATFDMVTLSPRTLGAISTISRQLLTQSTPDIDAIVASDFVRVMALAVDEAALFGSGLGSQPLGIVNHPGVGSYATATSGSDATFDVLLQMKEALLAANAPMDALGYAINPATYAYLASLKATTGSYLWPSISNGVANDSPDRIWGDRYVISNQLPANGTKGSSSGVCSTAIYGNWSELIVGTWTGPTLLANPYGAGYYNTGAIQIRVMQLCDINLRHPVSFCVANGLLTVPGA